MEATIRSRPPTIDITTRLNATVGDTPVVFIDEPFASGGRGYWAKLEGMNPGGIKDRSALHMIRRARERGELRAGARIVEATSGTFGLGLALAGITYGHPVALVTDPGMERMMFRMLQAYGVYVELVDTPCPGGGWQEARRRRVQALLTAEPDAYSPDQYNNPDNVAAYAPLARELTIQLGRIDILVCSVGTGGHSAGIVGELRKHNPSFASSVSTPSARRYLASKRDPASCEASDRASILGMSTTTPLTRCIGLRHTRPYGPAGPWR